MVDACLMAGAIFAAVARAAGVAMRIISDDVGKANGVCSDAGSGIACSVLPSAGNTVRGSGWNLGVAEDLLGAGTGRAACRRWGGAGRAGLGTDGRGRSTIG